MPSRRRGPPLAPVCLCLVLSVGLAGCFEDPSRHFAEAFNTQSRWREASQTLPCVDGRDSPTVHQVKREKEVIRIQDPYWIVESTVQVNNTVTGADPDGICTRPARHDATVRRRFRPQDMRFKNCYDRPDVRVILLDCKDGSNCVSVDGDCQDYDHRTAALFATGTLTCDDARAAFR